MAQDLYRKNNEGFEKWGVTAVIMRFPRAILILLSLIFLHSPSGSAHIQTIFGPLEDPQTYSEAQGAGGDVLENYRGFQVSRYPQLAPELLGEWTGKEIFLKRRHLILSAAAKALSATGILPVGSALYLKDKVVGQYKWLFRGETSDANGGLPPSAVGFSAKTKIFKLLNTVLWESRSVLIDAKEYGASVVVFEAGVGLAEKTPEEDRGPSKIKKGRRFYGYGNLNFNFGINFEQKEIFCEIAVAKETLSDVYSYVAELTAWGTRFSLFSSSQEISQTMEVRKGEVRYGLGLGAFILGPKYFSVGGTLPFVGALSLPPPPWGAPSFYKTNWSNFPLLRVSYAPSKSFLPRVRFPAGIMRSCNSVLGMKLPRL